MTDTHTRTQHSPGPWQWFADVEEQRVELWGVNADVQGDDPIVTAHATDLIGADRDPNLRLIAAAPDLLAALEQATAWLEDLLYEPLCAVDEANRDGVADTITAARAAIARARYLSA